MPSTSIEMNLIAEIQNAARRIPTLAGPSQPEPPASANEVAAFERNVGRRLPDLWRRVYTEVGNGGFGPGYGLLGLISGAKSDEGDSALELYRTFVDGEDPEDPEFRWPLGVVPICHWGCAIDVVYTKQGDDWSREDGRKTQDARNDKSRPAQVALNYFMDFTCATN